MADRYVDPSVGASGTGLSWAQAYKTLKEATDAAAAGENIYFANGTSDVITVDTTYTLANGVTVYSTSDTTNNPPTTYATGATVDGSATNNIDITINGRGALYGVTFNTGKAFAYGTIRLGTADNSVLNFYDCQFVLTGGEAQGVIRIGGVATGPLETEVYTQNCSFSFSGTNQGLAVASSFRSSMDNFSVGASHPSVLFEVIEYNAIVDIVGGDLSDISTVFESAPNSTFRGTLFQCKMKTGFTVFSPIAAGQGEVLMVDCSDGDQHYHIGHWNYYGSTTVSTSVYCVTGESTYDGTNKLSWLVSSTANATRATPYVSPPIDVYNSGTSAITPYLECVRSGSATAYTDAEIWSEWLYKGTAGSTRATLVHDKCAPLAGAVNQTASSLGASDWTGEGATSTFMKLGPTSSITPAEIGDISVRIVIGKDSVTDLYVSPTPRGMS